VVAPPGVGQKLAVAWHYQSDRLEIRHTLLGCAFDRSHESGCRRGSRMAFSDQRTEMPVIHAGAS